MIYLIYLSFSIHGWFVSLHWRNLAPHFFSVSIKLAGHQNTVEFLLSRKVDVLSTNDSGGGAISAAATTGHREVLKQLVDARGNLEESDDRGDTWEWRSKGTPHSVTRP